MTQSATFTIKVYEEHEAMIEIEGMGQKQTRSLSGNATPLDSATWENESVAECVKWEDIFDGVIAKLADTGCTISMEVQS